MSRVIIDALQAELVADEIAGNHTSNGWPLIGSGWHRSIVPYVAGTMAHPSMPERVTRIGECRRYLSVYVARVGDEWLVDGVTRGGTPTAGRTVASHKRADDDDPDGPRCLRLSSRAWPIA